MKPPKRYRIQGDELPLLFQRFEHEYGDEYIRLADGLKESYPDITRKGRRTGRALRNICLFVWCYTRAGERDLIPILFKASVLLSAQDDYYDNPSIPTTEKDAFCSAINDFIRARSFHSPTGTSHQVQELTSLWSDVARGTERASPRSYSHWSEKACQLNEAMAAENRAIRRADVTYDEYMRTAIHSVGMVFVWSTYLAHKNVPLSAMRDMDPVLLVGSTIVRLSNDIASYRQAKDKRNAVILLGGEGTAEARVLQLMEQEARMLRQRLHALGVRGDVRRAILRSTKFLREFYQRSDFDRRAPW